MEPVGVAALVGVIVPFIVSFLKNVSWSPRVKQGLALVISLAAALGVTIWDQGLDWDNVDLLITNLGVVFTAAQLFYTQYFGNTSLNAALERSGVGAGE